MARTSTLGLAGFLSLVALSVLAGADDFGISLLDNTISPKLLGIVWFAFAAMAGAALFSLTAGNDDHAKKLVWGYGVASGAMITSAAVFLIPPAIGHHTEIGGFGVAFGILTGFVIHTVGHRLTHADVFSGGSWGRGHGPSMDHTVVELTAHSFAAGSIMGLVYAAMPELGPLLGLAIVSHKGPAGYAAARRLIHDGKGVSILLLPASGVGIAAILAGLVQPPTTPVVHAAVFGFAAGIFLHVAMDFLPQCELGGEVYEAVKATGAMDASASGREAQSQDAHSLLDRLRVHAVASTGLGALAVFSAWTVF